MWATYAVELMSSRASRVADAVFEVSLHKPVGAGAMRTHRPAALATTELPFDVFAQSVID